MRAIALDLDTKAQEAFLRLSGGLSALGHGLIAAGKSLSFFGEDLISEPALPITEISPSCALEDLGTVLGQVKDEELQKRLSAAIETIGGIYSEPELAVPQTTIDKVSVTVIGKAQADKDEHTVLGIVLEPEVIDAQDDIYSAAEIKKTAFKFMEQYQNFGFMHQEIVQDILPLESYLAPCDFVIEGKAVKKGTWLMRVRVLDAELWQGIKSGSLTGFSIGGSAIRTPELIEA